MIAVSKYAMQLDEYTKRFPRQHILLLALEDLKRNPQLLLERVCRFLEIDPEFKFEGLSVMRNPSLVDHPLYTLLGKVPLLPTVVKKVMPTRHRRALRNRLGRKLEVETKVSDAQRDRIMTELREDMRRLRDEYGFDVSRWDLACPPGTDPGRMLGSCGFWI